jgi:hypothetical protein
VEGKPRQGKARQDKARQGNARKARQGKARQGEASLGREGKAKAKGQKTHLMFHYERSAKRYFQPKRVTDTFCPQNCDSKSVLAIRIQVSRDIIVFNWKILYYTVFKQEDTILYSLRV